MVVKLKDIPKSISRPSELNLGKYNIMNANISKVTSSSSSSPVPELVPELTGMKRSHDDKEHDEEWVKRIQLDSVPDECKETRPRGKRRKFVLLLSYCGKGYLGMQRNPGYPTIEDELLMAMLQSSLIKEEGVTYPQMYRFQRAARTDKGVSAVRQIVSVKLPDDVDIPKAINEHLPEQIRVMRAVRVTQKFDSKNQCDSRSYSYLCPTFAFAPKEIMNDDYKLTPDVLEELRSIFEKYKGTHNFHNFTARVKYSDQCANRYIMDINCSDPFVRSNLQWTKIKVRGQSFMLHQIRKMVGLAMAICKGYVSKDIFKRVWGHERLDIPIAPGLGLVLEEPHYDYYNRKHCNDGIHECLKWGPEEEKIQAFREKYIDSVIVNTEMEEKSMLKWLETLELHTFDRRTDGPPGERPSSEDTRKKLNDHDNSKKETRGFSAQEENGDLGRDDFTPEDNTTETVSKVSLSSSEESPLTENSKEKTT